jgi:three-Cys-motif partner protein
LEPDGLYTPDIKRHSLEKLSRHNYYAAIFSAAMHRKWPQRAYIGLYSGAGRARLVDTGEVVETSAMAVVRQSVPFTKYIFVDEDRHCLEALEARVRAAAPDVDATFILGSVNQSVAQVLAAMPPYGSRHGGLLSLCFVDPFRVDLDFRVIRELNRYAMDFLIMVPLGYDVRRNVRRYLADPEDRLGALIDSSDWRQEWRERRESEKHFVRFVWMKFDQAMQRLGFRARDISETLSVKVTGMEVFLYALALYSKHELGERFWRTTVESTDTRRQIGFDF